MGILRSLLILTIPLSVTPFYAFSLKSLPQHSRQIGNNLGLFYLYLKSLLKFLQPDSTQVSLISQNIRKTNLALQIFNRESQNIMKNTKKEINFNLDLQSVEEKQTYTPINTGINQLWVERLRLQQQRKIKKQINQFYTKI